MKCIIKAQFCNQMKSDEIMHIHVTLVEVIKIKQNAISIASTCIPKNLFLQSFSTALNIVLNFGQLEL